jgi:uncharacterized protein YdgA (DUF945 family)
MNKATRVLLAIGVIIVLSYPGIAWVTGMAVESRLQHNEQQALANSPYVTVVKREYHRGVYRSTAITTFALHIPAPLAPGPAAAAAALLSSFTITVASNIQHGPLLGLHGVGLAAIDSTVVVPPALQKELSAVVGSKPIAQLRSTVGLLGGTTGELTSPAFSMRLPNGSDLVWDGLTATGSSSRNQASWAGKLSVPRLLVAGPMGRFELTGVEYSGTHRRAFEGLYLGTGTFTIERLDGSSPRPGSDFSLQRVAVTTTSKADGDFFDMRVDIAMDAAKVAALQLTNVMYSLGFEHVDGHSFVSMVQAVRTAQLQAAGNRAQLQAGIQGAFRQYGVEMLAHDPVLDIRQVSFTMPEGSLLLSAKISAPGLAPADLQMPAAVTALRTHAQVTADLRVDNGLVQKLLAMGGSNPRFAAQLTSFEQQGYLTAGPASVSTHFEFSGSRMALNGHPFPRAPPVN